MSLSLSKTQFISSSLSNSFRPHLFRSTGVSLFLKVGLFGLVGLLPINAFSEDPEQVEENLPAVLKISPVQQSSLGLEFGTPKPLDQSFGAEWPARVTAPSELVQAFSLPVDVMVEQLFVSPGEAVEKGQLLARLDSRQLRLWANELLVADEQQAQCLRELELLNQRLELGLSRENEVVQKESDCRILSRRLDSAMASLRHAGWSKARIEQLRKGGVLEENLELTASVKGVVAELAMTPGQHLEAGVTLFELWPLSELRVQANIPDSLASSIPLQSQALVWPRTQGEQFVARVERISDQVDEHNRRSVWLNIEGNSVNSGAAYKVRFSQQTIQGEARSTWAVPTKAVVREADHDWIFVQVPEGIEVRQVNVLGVIEGELQIVADLPVNTRIAVTATAALKGLWLGMGGE